LGKTPDAAGNCPGDRARGLDFFLRLCLLNVGVFRTPQASKKTARVAAQAEANVSPRPSLIVDKKNPEKRSLAPSPRSLNPFHLLFNVDKPIQRRATLRRV